MRKTISRAAFAAEVEARKRALLARMARRAKAAGDEPVRAST